MAEGEAVVVRTHVEAGAALDDLLGKGELRKDLAWLVNLVHRFVAAGIDVEIDARRRKVGFRINERLYVLLYGYGNPRRLLLEDAVHQFQTQLVLHPAACTPEQAKAVCRIFDDELKQVALPSEEYEAKASVTPKAFW